MFFKLQERCLYQPNLLNYAFKLWRCFVDCAAVWMYMQMYAHFQPWIYYSVSLLWPVKPLETQVYAFVGCSLLKLQSSGISSDSPVYAEYLFQIQFLVAPRNAIHRLRIVYDMNPPAGDCSREVSLRLGSWNSGSKLTCACASDESSWTHCGTLTSSPRLQAKTPGLPFYRGHVYTPVYKDTPAEVLTMWSVCSVCTTLV